MAANGVAAYIGLFLERPALPPLDTSVFVTSRDEKCILAHFSIDVECDPKGISSLHAVLVGGHPRGRRTVSAQSYGQRCVFCTPTETAGRPEKAPRYPHILGMYSPRRNEEGVSLKLPPRPKEKVWLCWASNPGPNIRLVSSRLLKIIEGTAYRLNRSSNEREALT